MGTHYIQVKHQPNPLKQKREEQIKRTEFIILGFIILEIGYEKKKL